jgi:hypothetical protein
MRVPGAMCPPVRPLAGRPPVEPWPTSSVRWRFRLAGIRTVLRTLPYRAAVSNEKHSQRKDAGCLPRQQPPGPPPCAGSYLNHVGYTKQDERPRRHRGPSAPRPRTSRAGATGSLSARAHLRASRRWHPGRSGGEREQHNADPAPYCGFDVVQRLKRVSRQAGPSYFSFSSSAASSVLPNRYLSNQAMSHSILAFRCSYWRRPWPSPG